MAWSLGLQAHSFREALAAGHGGLSNLMEFGMVSASFIIWSNSS